MEVDQKTIEMLEAMDNPDLLQVWAGDKEMLAYSRERMDRIEMELRRRMDQDKATELDNPDWIVRIEAAKPEYDQPKLIAGLREAVSPERFDTCYIPEETRVIPARINMTKAKPLRRLGAEVVAAIDGALLPPLPGKLRITARTTP